MMTMEGMMDAGVLDDIIRRLLEGKGGKQVQLSDVEIRQLCVNARQIFLSQPNLLPVRAPIRICEMQSQLVCSGCRTVLLYPRGAANVCCAICNVITAVPPAGG